MVQFWCFFSNRTQFVCCGEEQRVMAPSTDGLLNVYFFKTSFFFALTDWHWHWHVTENQIWFYDSRLSCIIFCIVKYFCDLYPVQLNSDSNQNICSVINIHFTSIVEPRPFEWLYLQTICVAVISPLIPCRVDTLDSEPISLLTKQHIRRHFKQILGEPLSWGLWSLSLWKCRLISPDGSSLFVVFSWSSSVTLDC